MASVNHTMLPGLLWARETANDHRKHQVWPFSGGVAPRRWASATAARAANAHAVVAAMRRAVLATKAIHHPRNYPTRLPYLDDSRLSREMDRL